MAARLVIFNINTSISQLVKRLDVTEEKLVILTSHALYPFEISQLKESFSQEMILYHFGSFNSNKDLLAIDKRSFELNRKYLKKHYLYLNNYKLSMNHLKNEFIHQHIIQKENISKIEVFGYKDDLDNLGISTNYWKNISNCTIHFLQSKYSIKKRLLRKGRLAYLSYHLQAFINSKRRIKLYHFKFQGEHWYTPSLYRLKLKKDIQIHESYSSLSSIPQSANYIIGLHEAGKMLNVDPYLKPHQLLIIGDAFRPTNYPPYLFAYPIRNRGTYIPKDEIDASFFENSGVLVNRNRPSFLQEELVSESKSNKINEVNTIILSLNHAGDWTSLISRSDTDLLIAAFTDLAKEHGNKSFIIRLHPTMAGKRAEGSKAFERIHQHVKNLDLMNLSVSDLTLEEDWERGDLFISEYSLSVIDAIKRGKLGVFCNLTNRQSFMKDWEDLGAITYKDLSPISSLITSSEKLAQLSSQCQKALSAYRISKMLK